MNIVKSHFRWKSNIVAHNLLCFHSSLRHKVENAINGIDEIVKSLHCKLKALAVKEIIPSKNKLTQHKVFCSRGVRVKK